MSQLVRLEGKHSSQNAHCAVVSGRVGGVWLFSVGWGHTVQASILAVDEIERDGSGKSDGVDEGEGDD